MDILISEKTNIDTVYVHIEHQTGPITVKLGLQSSGEITIESCSLASSGKLYLEGSHCPNQLSFEF